MCRRTGLWIATAMCLTARLAMTIKIGVECHGDVPYGVPRNDSGEGLAVEEFFERGEVEFDVGRAAVVALGAVWRLFHLAQQAVHFGNV